MSPLILLCSCMYAQSQTVACRGPGRLLDCMPPYQILILSSGVYAICDVATWRHIHVCKPRFWRGLFIEHAFCILHALSLRVVVRCVTVINIITSALQVRRPEQETAFIARTEPFITAKYPATRQNRRVEHILCYANAVHNCKNIRLRIKTVE